MSERSETEKIVRQFHESWDLRDPERGARIIAENCHFEDMARQELLPGPEGYKRDYHRWREAFPDGEVKVVNVIVEGDWAVVEFLNRGTHTGPLHSSLGTFPPSGKKMEIRYCSVMRVEDGMVVEGRDYYDSATIARQLGLIDGSRRYSVSLIPLVLNCRYCGRSSPIWCQLTRSDAQT